MDLFLGWSGTCSKAVAEALKLWLSQVLQAVEPWISSDIDKGARWSDEVATRLAQRRLVHTARTRILLISVAAA
jgi:hypothetical protein